MESVRLLATKEQRRKCVAGCGRKITLIPFSTVIICAIPKNCARYLRFLAIECSESDAIKWLYLL